MSVGGVSLEGMPVGGVSVERAARRGLQAKRSFIGYTKIFDKPNV